MSCKHTSRWSPKQRLQLRFIFLGSCNNFIALQTSVTFFIAAISCDNCNFCHNRYSCHSHSSQKCELCTECGTSKMISGLVKHWMCLTCPPIDNSVQLNDRKRRLFYHLGSMVFCNKWLYHLEPWAFNHLLIICCWHIAKNWVHRLFWGSASLLSNGRRIAKEIVNITIKANN